jgi:hypothetical protein
LQSNDSISYVYSGSVKKQVILGPSNENEVIIREGLEAGEEVYLVAPSDAENFRLVRLDEAIIGKYRSDEKNTE